MQVTMANPSRTAPLSRRSADKSPEQKKTDAAHFPMKQASTESVQRQESNRSEKEDQGDANSKVQTHQSALKNAAFSPLDTVYDDPAVIHVVEREEDDYNEHRLSPCFEDSDADWSDHSCNSAATHGDKKCMSLKQEPSHCSGTLCDCILYLIARRVRDKIQAQIIPTLSDSTHDCSPCHHDSKHTDSETPCQWNSNCLAHCRKRCPNAHQTASHTNRQTSLDMDHNTGPLNAHMLHVIQATEPNAVHTPVLMKPEECLTKQPSAEDALAFGHPHHMQRSQSMPDNHTSTLVDKIAHLEAEKAALLSAMDELKSTQNQQLEELQAQCQQWANDKNKQNSAEAILCHVQKAYQSLQTRLSEEQWKSSQLENKCAALHKRQLEHVQQNERLALRVQELETELQNVAQRGTRDAGRGQSVLGPSVEQHCKTVSQHRRQPSFAGKSKMSHQQHHSQKQHQQQQRQQYYHQQVYEKTQPQRARVMEHHIGPNKPPTPRLSPSTSLKEDEESCIKEEDGYLVFNSNIDGEVIHCRVKIPNSRATTARSSPVMRRPVDFPMALVSPPMTRIESPQQRYKPMVAPLGDLLRSRRGLNPNAPEWNGHYKQTT